MEEIYMSTDGGSPLADSLHADACMLLLVFVTKPIVTDGNCHLLPFVQTQADGDGCGLCMFEGITCDLLYDAIYLMSLCGRNHCPVGILWRRLVADFTMAHCIETALPVVPFACRRVVATGHRG